MATLQGKAVKNTYRQVLQIGANNIGVTSTLQAVQDGAGVNTALSLSTIAATVNGDLTVTGDLIITGGGLQIKELIDDTVADLIKNGTGITWTYNDGANTLTGNFTGTTSVVAEGSNLYYTQGRFDSAFAAKTTTNLTEGANLYFTTARGDANFATNFATKTTTNLPEGTNLYFTNVRARTALSVTGGTGISYDNTTGVFNLAAIPNASLTNSSITINGQATALGSSVTLTTTNIAEGTNLYFTNVRARTALSVTASTGLDYNNTTGVFGLSAIPNASLTNSSVTINSQVVSLGSSITLTTTDIAEGTNLYYTQARFDTAFGNKSTTNLAEGTNLYYTQARFNTAFTAKSTTDLAEGTNLYYTDARARLALSSSATGLSYANNSGVFSLTAGYAIPTTVKLGQYDTAYNRSIVSAAVTGTTTKTLTLTEQDANTITATWTDLGITTINGTANQIAATTAGNTTTIGFTNDVTMPNNLVVSGNLTINGTATYVNTQAISAKDPLFEVANDNNTTDAVDIGYYGRYYDTPQTRVEFTGLFRDASDAGKFKFFTGLVDEPTNVVNTTGTGYTVGTLVANFEGNLAGTANAANVLSTARSISVTGDAAWTTSFDGSANATGTLTLANTGVTATTYGTSTAVPTIAIDSKGRITSASNTNIAFPVTSVNGQAGTVVLTTSDVAEGTNQYFTTARAQAAISGTAPISVASGVVSISQSGAATNGFLSSTDWNTFNNKLSTATAATTYVPYTGATGNVNIGSYILSAAEVRATSSAGLSINANSGTQIANLGAGGGANMTLYGGLTGTTGTFVSSGNGDSFTINHTSGSGIALNITKNGNGEGLYINKASGSGNAATIVGNLGGTSATFSSTLGVTGALTGTSATFTSLNVGNGTTASASININSDASTASYLYFNGATVTNNHTYIIGNGGASSNLKFYTANTLALTIASTSAATFSNSITATEGIFSSGGVDGSLGSAVRISSTNTNGNARNWALINTFESYGDLNFRVSTSQGGNALSAGSTMMTITRVGNVGIGTIIPVTKLDVSGTIRSIAQTDPTSGIGLELFYRSADPACYVQSYDRTNSAYVDLKIAAGRILFYYANPASVECGRFTGLGYLKVSNTGNYNNVGGGYHEIRTSATDSDVVIIQNTSASPYGINLAFTAASPNNTANYFLNCSDATNTKLIIYSNGNVVNRNNSYGPISDIKLKENISDTTPKLDKLMQVRIVNYNLIGDELNQIGVIAQELEQIFPGLVDEHTDYDEDKNDLGTTTKSVKMSVFVPMIIKAMQEQQAQIEELKAMIAAK
jgi:hypothetical protein